jgi:hypothetical protein
MWRYNCHMCGTVVCDNCSQRKFTLPPVWTTEPVRVCDGCVASAIELGGVAPGNGRVLGGGQASDASPTAVADPAAEMRAKMAAARVAQQSKNPARPSSASATKRPNPAPAATPSSTATPTSVATPNANATSATTPTQTSSECTPASETRVDSSVLTTSEDCEGAVTDRQSSSSVLLGDGSVDSPSNPVLLAAMRRKAEAEAKGGRGGPAVDPEKQGLILQILAALKAKGEEEPFGLRSMEKPKLQMYLRHLQQRS